MHRNVCILRRFGKHRKTMEVPLHFGVEDGIVHEERESHQQDLEKEKERQAARQAAQDEQQRIQEQYRRLVQRQRQMEQQVRNVLIYTSFSDIIHVANYRQE